MTESNPTSSGVDVAVDAVIHRPLSEVADYANDPSNAPAWYSNISTVDWKTPPPLQAGTRVAFAARFLGRTMRYTYEVAEHTPTSLIMRTSEGPFPMETTYQYEAMPDGHTRMTLRNRGNPTGVSRLLSPLLGRAMRRANRRDLVALKRILEG